VPFKLTVTANTSALDTVVGNVMGTAPLILVYVTWASMRMPAGLDASSIRYGRIAGEQLNAMSGVVDVSGTENCPPGATTVSFNI
jgi:hypothetical protein